MGIGAWRRSSASFLSWYSFSFPRVSVRFLLLLRYLVISSQIRERDKRFFDFSKPFQVRRHCAISELSSFNFFLQTVIFIAFGSTAVVDSAIAGTLSYLLLKTDPGPQTKSRGVIKFLVLFFIGTGLLTACVSSFTLSQSPCLMLYTQDYGRHYNLCGKSCIRNNWEERHVNVRLAQYAARPSTALYLSIEFAVPRRQSVNLLLEFILTYELSVYVNSILAMCVITSFYGDSDRS